MIYCPKCGTANPRGSRFCNECGESLPMRTALRCPMCGTMNPVGSVHCARCQARLIPMAAAPRPEEWERPEAPAGEPAPATTPPEGEQRVEQAAGEAEPEAGEAEDWLAQLRAGAPEGEAVVGEEPEAAEEPIEPVELPDWLRDLGPVGVETRPLPREGLPPVQALPEEEPPAAAGVTGRFEEPAPARIPDWLREIVPPEAAPPEITPPTAEARPREAPEEALPTVPPPTPAEVPDWPREAPPLEAAPPAAEARPREVPEEAPPVVVPPIPAEIPDWLREALAPEAPAEVGPPEALPAAVEVAPEEAPPTVPPPPPAEIPDWLREAVIPEAPPETAAPAIEEMPEEAIPPVAPPTPAEIPDWLLEAVPPEAPPEEMPTEAAMAPEEVIPTVAPPTPAEFPDWLREPAPPQAPPSEAPAPEVAVEEPAPAAPPPTVPELPEWLREMAWEEIPTEVPPEEAPLIPSLVEFPAEGIFPPEELVRAEIPDWLEALRPRPEAPEVAAEMEPVETEGPLEGLASVLAPTSAFEVLAFRERARPSRTSEVSLARAELLQGLLVRPVEAPRPEVRERAISLAERVQRWLVAAVLLLAVGGMLIAPFLLLSQDIPALSKPATSPTAGGRAEFHRLTRTYDVIQTMSAGDTLLVAFEYGPAEADELNMVAEPLLRHALDRGVHISPVTTRPEGRTLAAGLLYDIVASEERYAESQTMPLDYQTGDAAGVSRLLTDAQRHPELILVLTAQPGPLRWWVEQTRALYGDTLPVLAGVSAALEPAASPYLDIAAGQLEGAVTGLNGAAAYETLRGSVGNASQRLSALTAGHGAIVGLVILGALFYTLVGARGREK